MTDPGSHIPPQPARRRRHFYAVDASGDTIAWRTKRHATAWCALSPATRQLVGALHPAIRRAGRQGALIEALPGSALLEEAKAAIRASQLAPPAEV